MMTNFNYDPSKPQILSMGWGVQTFGMLVMIEKGLLPKPDLIIHADTKAEKPETIEFKNKIGIPLIEKLGIEYVEVSKDRGIIYGYLNLNSIPQAGFRSCTDKYKVEPLNYYLRDRYKDMIESKPYYQCWIGISTDEKRRRIPKEDQRPKYQQMIYPFLDLNYSRNDIIDYIKSNGYEIPVKSGCFMCPYAGLRGFLELKEKHPDLFNIAVHMENNYFENRPERDHGFLMDSKIKLQTLKEMKSLFSYQQIENNMNECDSGGCFL